MRDHFVNEYAISLLDQGLEQSKVAKHHTILSISKFETFMGPELAQICDEILSKN
jgi:hypothetical protein